MEERGWTVTGLDLGGTLKRSRLQSKIKFDAVLRALREMNYACLNLGPEELALGAEEMLTRFDPNGKPAENLPFLSANVTLFGSADLGVPQRYRVYEVNGIKIGVTSVVSPKLTVDNPYLEGDITVADPAELLVPVVESLKAETPDLMILLSHADTEETRACDPEVSAVPSGRFGGRLRRPGIRSQVRRGDDVAACRSKREVHRRGRFLS